MYSNKKKMAISQNSNELQDLNLVVFQYEILPKP